MILTSHYYAYLLRIWQPENQIGDEWLASLEDPKSREVLYFKTLEELFYFLREIPKCVTKTDQKI